MLRSMLARWMHRTRKPYCRQEHARRREPFRPLLDALEDRTLLSSGASLSDAYGQLPLSFEANQGQTDAQVDFVARGQGYTIFLTPQAAILKLQQADAAGSEAVRMQLVGGNADAPAAGVDQLQGSANYYIGNDPTQWHTGIATFARVQYDNVYDGIDLVYYGKQQQLEYDFVVAPGAAADAILLDFQGVESLSLNDRGDLVLHTVTGDITQHAPIVYQDVDGQRQFVSAGFVLSGGHQVGFQIGAHDLSKPLVIDPVVLSYSTYLGGGLNDVANGIALDSGGNAYVTGSTNSINFPTKFAFQPAYQDSSNTDAFVTKLSPDGTTLVFSTYLGGANADQANGIAVDSTGTNAFVVGQTTSVNFPTTQGSLQPQLSGSSDAFVARFSANGALVYNTFLGGLDADSGRAIAVDNFDQAYVTGSTFSTTFPTTAGSLQPTKSAGVITPFVTKINSAGSQILYSTFLGPSGTGSAITVNAQLGLAYIAGNTASNSFPTTANAPQTTLGGATDGFFSELNQAGSALLYSTYIGGSTTEQVNGIAIFPDVDGKNTGNDFLYVAGSTDSSNFPVTPNVVQGALGGNVDAFVTMMAPNAPSAGAFVYSTFLGGLASDIANDISADGQGNAYIVGQTNSSNFPVSASRLQGPGGLKDVFISELNSVGTVLLYSTYLGGTLDDNGLSIAIAPGVNGTNAYVSGSTAGLFPVTTGAFETTYNGGFTDGFVAKLADLPTPANHLAFGVQPSNTLFSAPITPAITVRVLDSTNQVVANNNDFITIAIGANPGGGVLGGTVTIQAQQGVATFSNLTISKPGTGYTLVASSTGSTIQQNFAVSNPFNIIQPTHLAFAQQPTTTLEGSVIAPPITVQILDANNQLVTADNTDQITIAIGTNPNNGVLGGVKTVTAVNGVATFDTLTISGLQPNEGPGNGYTLVASGSGLVSATSGTFDILDANPVATHLAFGVQPANTPPNSPIMPAITVQLLDVNNRVVTGDNTNRVTLTLGNNPSGAVLGGTRTVTAVNGVATFDNVTVSAVGIGYTLQANSPNPALTGATSNAFDVFIPLPATRLAFSQQPTNTLAGSTIRPPITIQILDATGAVVSTDNATVVTLAIANNPGGAALNGTVSVKAISGVATFSNLSINQAGVGYTLVASSGSLAGAISSPFNVIAGPVAQLGMQAPGLTDGCITMIVTVSALDQFGGVNPGYRGTVQFSSSDPAALLPPNYTFVSSDNGVHAFAVTISTVGAQTLTVSDISNPALFATVVMSVKNANVLTQYVTAPDAGGGPHVKVFDGVTRAVVRDFFAYDPRFTGGVRVAMGDVNADGVADIVTGPGPGGGPDIHVYDGASGQLIQSFFAFDPGFTGGVYVAVGDVNGDLFADVVVGADATGGPQVAVFSGADNSLLSTFFAYNANFGGGVRVATGDVNGDERADIICGAGAGGGPNVTVFSGADFSVLHNFFAYDPGFTAGIYVASGVFSGDSCDPADILTGPGKGGGPNVRVFDGRSGALVQNFLAEPVGGFALFPDTGLGFSGVRVSTINVYGTGAAIVTSFGSDHPANVNVFDFATATQIDTFFAYNPLFTGGVFLGIGSR